MGRHCRPPGTATCHGYLGCESEQCNQPYKYKRIIIGIDQSYNNTGISIAADGKLVKVRSLQLNSYKTNSDKRGALSKTLDGLLRAVCPKGKSVSCIIERVRLRSQGFLNIDYIKSIGALNSAIVDICHKHRVSVSSVDTRCWKAQVIGTSKPMPNKYGVPEEKWPTVKWLLNQGFEDSILIKVEGRKTKGTFVRDGQKYMYNNDAADSAGIALFGFIGDQDKLQKER